MSYGIIRVQKFKAPDVRGIQSHDRRERDPHSNPDIDRERSAQNYALVESPNFRASIQDRLETLKATKAVRKDAVVMCQFLVTSDHEFFQNLTPEKQKSFFQNALQFIGDRYGKENILAATVHMDEKTPHMHVNMTPIREGRLTAKEIFSRSELGELQTAFHVSVGRTWGLERGQSREDKRRHQDVATYKRTTAQAELEKVQAELAQVKAQAEKTKAELEKTKAELLVFKGVQESTARALADAQAWSIKKSLEAVQKEKDRQVALAKEKEIRPPAPSRGPGMRM